jgi:hypothetical protein
MQQIIKLQMAAQVNADLLLMVDSDVRLVRPVTSGTFLEDGGVHFYRCDNGIDDSLPRHLIWHETAAKLLGVPLPPPPLPDYTSSLIVWERDIVLGLHHRIQETTGMHWIDAVSSQLHVGEYILYGVFVDKVLGPMANVAPSDEMLCHCYWEVIPLDMTQAAEFVRGMSAHNVAIMISSKSGTSPEVRRSALARLS